MLTVWSFDNSKIFSLRQPKFIVLPIYYKGRIRLEMSALNIYPYFSPLPQKFLSLEVRFEAYKANTLRATRKRPYVNRLRELPVFLCDHAHKRSRPPLTQFPFQVLWEVFFHDVDNWEVITTVTPLTAWGINLFAMLNGIIKWVGT